MKRAFITGICGQDGSYLAELLLEKGYEVHGLKRRASNYNTQRIDHLPDLQLHYGDMTDGMNLTRLIDQIGPDEIYNLAAQSHVQVSFETPEYTLAADGGGALRLLEAVRICGGAYGGGMKLYQASTSEMFGDILDHLPPGTRLTEDTPFHPRSPYAAAKLYAYWITRNYREAYQMFACNGILLNHESKNRGPTFVTRKITLAVANIQHGKQDVLRLGNLNALRDWGHAKDYVRAMYLALQHTRPDDYLVATGAMYSVRSFVERAFKYIDYDIIWAGKGVDEYGYDRKTGRKLVVVDPKYFRPTEVNQLIGNAFKARRVLGWKPLITFDELVDEMMRNDLSGQMTWSTEE